MMEAADINGLVDCLPRVAAELEHHGRRRYQPENRARRSHREELEAVAGHV